MALPEFALEAFSFYMTFDEILVEKICSKDDLRPLLKMIQHQDGKIIATDANIMVVAPNSYSNTEIKFIEGFPNWLKAIPEHKQNSIFNITLSSIKKSLLQIKKIAIYKDCKTCDGSGVIECECCGHDSDCEDCNGDGTTNEITDNRYNANKDCVQINSTKFNPNYLESMARIAHCIGETELRCCLAEKNTGFCFYAKDILIVLMPYRDWSELDYENTINVKLS